MRIPAITSATLRRWWVTSATGWRLASRANGAPNLEQVGAYALLNARLAWEFARGEVFVAGENLLDRDYRYRPGYTMPGIGGSVGVKVKF